MEEIEVPTEHLHEAVHHEAHHSQETWITWVALSTALLAALAAVAALLSGMNANEALIDRVTSSDTWSQFQANSIKLSNLEANADAIKLRNEQVPAWFSEKMKKYDGEKDKLAKKAKAEEEAFHQRLERHEILAHGVTMFQIAIAIAAIAALTKRRWFWYLGLGFGVIGTAFLVYAVTAMKVTEPNEEKSEQKESKEKNKDSKGSPNAKQAKSESEGANLHFKSQINRFVVRAAPHPLEIVSTSSGFQVSGRNPSPFIPRSSPLPIHVHQNRVA